MNSVLSVLPASPRKKKTCFSLNHGFDDHGQAVSISPKHRGLSAAAVCVCTRVHVFTSTLMPAFTCAHTYLCLRTHILITLYMYVTHSFIYM